MVERVDPDPARWSEMRPGEQALMRRLCAVLGEGWEVYGQPHLNGLRPDVVAFHPERGLVVYEVKDYKEFEEDGTPRGLWRHGVRSREAASGLRYTGRHPVEQVLTYAEELEGLLKHAADSPLRVQPALMVTAQTTEVARNWIRREPRGGRLHVLGGRDLQGAGEPDLVAALHGAPRHTPNPAALARIRNLLGAPAPVDLPPLPLDAKQRKAALDPPGLYRRVKGPAGSGKSVLLAARAAELAARHRDVLVVTYTSTLPNYLRVLTERHHPAGGDVVDPRRLTFLHFHGWLRRLFGELGQWRAWRQIIGSEEHGDSIADRLNAACAHIEPVLDAALAAGEARTYDAVLVDEAQDFAPHWWALLRRILRPGGDAWIAADRTQTLYSTNWTDRAMTGAGFPGQWMMLEESYRLPAALIDPLSDLVRNHLSNERLPPQTGQAALGACDVRWVATPDSATRYGTPAQADRTADEVEHLLRRGYHPSEIVVLTTDHALATRVSATLRQRQWPARTIVSSEAKRGFYPDQGAVAVTTVHSFKGWEARGIVLSLRGRHRRLYQLAYVGMSRVRWNLDGCALAIITNHAGLLAFCRTWFPPTRPEVPAPTTQREGS